MRLLKQTDETWKYHLHQNEADILKGLIKKFPFTETGPAQITRAKNDAQAVEREKLLAESLAEHRKELKRLAADLLEPGRWRKADKGQTLTLNAHSREILLQILNDIRVGSWHALGEPDPLEAATGSTAELALRNLMELAGYFEMGLLNFEE